MVGPTLHLDPLPVVTTTMVYLPLLFNSASMLIQPLSPTIDIG